MLYTPVGVCDSNDVEHGIVCNASNRVPPSELQLALLAVRGL